MSPFQSIHLGPRSYQFESGAGRVPPLVKVTVNCQRAHATLSRSSLQLADTLQLEQEEEKEKKKKFETRKS